VSAECVLNTMTRSPSSAGYSVINHGGDSLVHTPNTRTRFGSSRLHRNLTSLVESELQVLAATRPLSVIRMSIVVSHTATSPRCELPSLLTTFKQYRGIWTMSASRHLYTWPMLGLMFHDTDGGAIWKQSYDIEYKDGWYLKPK